jgi:pimeloyl-ACP methyl ester carboxylesterase
MPFARALDAKIHYSVNGRAVEPLVLVPGLGGHASEWGESFLQQLEAEHQLICLDNRGIERSESEVDNWSMQDMANDVIAVLDALGIERAHLLGTSMGGMIVQTLAVTKPERVRRLVLVATAFGGREMTGPEPRAAATFRPAPGLSTGELRRRSLRAITAEGFAAANPELIERLVRMRELEPTSSRVWQTQYAAILASDRSQLVTQITAPTLVLHGELDPLIPFENGERLARRIPNAKLVSLTGCGHLPYREQPDATAKAVLDFLRP